MAYEYNNAWTDPELSDRPDQQESWGCRDGGEHEWKAGPITQSYCARCGQYETIVQNSQLAAEVEELRARINELSEGLETLCVIHESTYYHCLDSSKKEAADAVAEYRNILGPRP